MGERSMGALFGKIKDVAEKETKRKKFGSDEAGEVLEETAASMSIGDVDRLKERLTEKIRGMKDLEEGLFWVGTLVGRAKLLWAMIRDKGFDVAAGTKLLVGAGLLYFVVPTDLLPDVIPGIGFVDDGIVLSTLWSTVQSEIERYVAFLHMHNRVISDAEAMAFADGPPSEQRPVTLESLESEAPNGSIPVADDPVAG